jgi:chromate transporter
MPEADALLLGITAVNVAIIVQAIWTLGLVAVKSRCLAALGVLGLMAVS